MRASNSTANIHTWNSPVPYLFGGLGLMSLLIATALIILACSYRKRPESQAGGKPANNPAILPLDPEPRIAVAMPGDDLPSFLAWPAAVPAEAAKTAPPPHALASGCDEKV